MVRSALCLSAQALDNQIGQEHNGCRAGQRLRVDAKAGRLMTKQNRSTVAVATEPGGEVKDTGGGPQRGNQNTIPMQA